MSAADLFSKIVKFYVGLHIINHADKFDRSFISVNQLYRRQSMFPVRKWIMDSGAFTEISTHGTYRYSVKRYADEIRRWVNNGTLECVVSQDYMCEPFILKKTGLTVIEHQRLTIQRYDELMSHCLPVTVMPVLQGFRPEEYINHLDQSGMRLTEGMRVGVGSVCKRNGSPASILAVLGPLKERRPDLKFHGFGIKTISLQWPSIRELLYSADSMSWSFAVRYERPGRQNKWQEAKSFERRISRLIHS